MQAVGKACHNEKNSARIKIFVPAPETEPIVSETEANRTAKVYPEPPNTNPCDKHSTKRILTEYKLQQCFNETGQL